MYNDKRIAYLIIIIKCDIFDYFKYGIIINSERRTKI